MGRPRISPPQTVQAANLAILGEGRAFAGVAGFSPFYSPGGVRLTGTGEPERITAVPVTERFFSLLGIQPRVGRFFSSEECQPNAVKTVMLDHGFWQRRFNRDSTIVGRAIVLDGVAATVVGVLPATFRLRRHVHTRPARRRLRSVSDWPCHQP